MTFLIRTIDLTATGREIVRDRVVEGDTLAIGRATTNDVVVADLAVEQHHVSVTRTDRGHLAIEAAGSRDFTFAGHKRKSVSIDPAAGGALTLGLYTLTFGLEADGRTLVTVTQEERERARLKRLAAKKADADRGEEIEVMADDGPIDEEDWKSALLAVLGKMPPDGFERLAQRLLREAGFTKVEVRGKSGDGGIDGVGVLRVNLVSFQVYFQCKRWKGSVGAKEIRDFRGALQGREPPRLYRRLLSSYFKLRFSLTSRLVRISPPLRLALCSRAVRADARC